MKNYEAVIGLEIHAELKTQSKMFCSCKNETLSGDKRSAISDKTYGIGHKPNINICPVCLGMPGVLPVLNKKAIDLTVRTGLRLNCKIAKFSKWDRKNYYYPDLPKGYQISQYDLPLCYEGYLKINDQRWITSDQKDSKSPVRSHQWPNSKKIRIGRIHLEEDTGTLKHPEGRVEVNYSLVDYNRAGLPLMELVTEPDITSAWEAREFCKEYQNILRELGVSDADMEKGQLRTEVNISLRPAINQKPKIKNQKLGTKVEIKNLNSFKALERAIEYEIERQTEVLESGGKIVQETRGWDYGRQRTYSMRTKETSADYRYFPEPDLPPVKITDEEIEKMRRELPESRDDKKKRYIEKYALLKEDAELIVNNVEMMRYFEECIQAVRGIQTVKGLVNWLINEVPDLSVKPKHLVELVELVGKGEISGKIAKEILPEIKKGKSPGDIIKERGLKVLSDEAELKKIVEKVLKENPEVGAKIKAGKMQVIGFLVGQVMRETKGQANPQIVQEIIRKKIK